MSKVLLIFDNYSELHSVETILKRVGFTVLGISTEYGIKEQILSFNPEVIVGYGSGSKFSSASISKKLKDLPRWHGKAVFIFPTTGDLQPEDLLSMRMDLMLRTPVPPARLLSVLARLFNRDDGPLLEKYKSLKSSERGPGNGIDSTRSGVQSFNNSSYSQKFSSGSSGYTKVIDNERIEIKGKVSGGGSESPSGKTPRLNSMVSVTGSSAGAVGMEDDILDPFTKEINKALKHASFGNSEDSIFGTGGSDSLGSMKENGSGSPWSEEVGEYRGGNEDLNEIPTIDPGDLFTIGSNTPNNSGGAVGNLTNGETETRNNSRAEIDNSISTLEGDSSKTTEVSSLGSPLSAPGSVDLPSKGQDVAGTASLSGGTATLGIASTTGPTPFHEDTADVISMRRRKLVGSLAEQMAKHEAIQKTRIEKYKNMTADIQLNPLSSLHRVDTRRVQKEMQKYWGFEELYDQDELRREFVEALFRKQVD